MIESGAGEPRWTSCLPVPVGRPDVELVSRAPGLRAGALASLLGALAVAGAWWRGGPRP